MSVAISPSLKAAAVIACLAAGSGASAQSLDTTGASFNAGYGRTPGQENRGVVVSNYGVRDASGNLVVIDGVIQSAGASSYSASSAAATATASASGGLSGGVGSSTTSTAIGNNLTVITQGDNNTVIVNSTQINNGRIVAGATTTNGATANAQ